MLRRVKVKTKEKNERMIDGVSDLSSNEFGLVQVELSDGQVINTKKENVKPIGF